MCISSIFAGMHYVTEAMSIPLNTNRMVLKANFIVEIL